MQMSKFRKRDESVFGVCQVMNYCRTNTRILFVSWSSNTMLNHCQCFLLSRFPLRLCLRAIRHWQRISWFDSCRNPLMLIFKLFGKVYCGDVDGLVSSRTACCLCSGPAHRWAISEKVDMGWNLALRARRTTWRGRPHIDLLDCAFYGLGRSFNSSHEGGASDQCRLSWTCAAVLVLTGARQEPAHPSLPWQPSSGKTLEGFVCRHCLQAAS